MSDMIVVACAHTTDPDAWAGLRDTAETFGVPLKVLGTDKPLGYASNDPRLFLESVPGTLAFLRSTTAEYVVQTDSFDVLCCKPWGDGSAVRQAILQANGNLLMSTEANCFPNGPWRAMYDALSQSPWRYPNAGQYCGTRTAVLRFLETLTERMRQIPEPYNPFGGAAQEILHHLFGEGYAMSLDTECRVFQSLYTGNARHIVYNGLTRTDAGDHRSYVSPTNDLTFTRPYFLHWNGRAPGMGTWYRALTGRPMPKNPMRPEYDLEVL